MKTVAEINEKIDKLDYEYCTRPAEFWELEQFLPEKISYRVWTRELRMYLIGGVAALEYNLEHCHYDVEVPEIKSVIAWIGE